MFFLQQQCSGVQALVLKGFHGEYHFESSVACSMKLFHYPVTPPRLEAISSSFFSQQTNWRPPKNRPRAKKSFRTFPRLGTGAGWIIARSWKRSNYLNSVAQPTFQEMNKVADLTLHRFSETKTQRVPVDLNLMMMMMMMMMMDNTECMFGYQDLQYFFFWKWWPPILEETKE